MTVDEKRVISAVITLLVQLFMLVFDYVAGEAPLFGSSVATTVAAPIAAFVAFIDCLALFLEDAQGLDTIWDLLFRALLLIYSFIAAIGRFASTAKAITIIFSVLLELCSVGSSGHGAYQAHISLGSSRTRSSIGGESTIRQKEYFEKEHLENEQLEKERLRKNKLKNENVVEVVEVLTYFNENDSNRETVERETEIHN